MQKGSTVLTERMFYVFTKDND